MAGMKMMSSPWCLKVSCCCFLRLSRVAGRCPSSNGAATGGRKMTVAGKLEDNSCLLLLPRAEEQVPPFLPMVQRREGEAGEQENDDPWQCWCVCISLPLFHKSFPSLLSVHSSLVQLSKGSPTFVPSSVFFSPFFLSRFLSSYPLTIAFFVSKLPSPFSFKRSLSLVQNSTSRPSHLTPPSCFRGLSFL